MGSQTPIYALPFPVGDDRVKDGDQAMQALAERTEVVLGQSRVDSGWVAIPALAGFTSSATYRKVGTFVVLRSSFANGSGNFTAPGTYTVGTVPAGARPAITQQRAVAVNWGGGLPLARCDVKSDGSVVLQLNTGTTCSQFWVDGICYYTD